MRTIAFRVGLIVITLIATSTSGTAQGEPPITVLTERLSIDRPFGAASIATTAINHAGDIAGYARTEGRARAFVWTQRRGYREIAPRRTAYHNVFAYDMNDLGIVVGEWTACADASCPPRGFMWTPRWGFSDLGTAFLPRAINASGAMGGQCAPGIACVTRRGRLVRVGPPVVDEGGPFSVVEGLNRAGDAAGYVTRASFSSSEAWMWPRRGPAAELSTSGFAFAYDINDRGLVSGFEVVNATAWLNGRPIALPFSSAFDGTARAVNNQNWIVGSGPHGNLGYHLGSKTRVQFASTSGDMAFIGDVNEKGWVVGSTFDRILVWRLPRSRVHHRERGR